MRNLYKGCFHPNPFSQPISIIVPSHRASRKTFPWLQAALVCLCSLPSTRAVAQQPQGQDNFKIVGLRTYNSNELIKVGDAWRKDLPKRIQATLRVGSDTPSSAVYVKAYFYDRDYHLISSYDKPNHIWASTGKGVEEIGLPPTLPHTKNTDVYFAIPDDLKAKNWTTVLVVFGNDTTAAASANPATAIAKLDFPEKPRVPAPHP